MLARRKTWFSRWRVFSVGLAPLRGPAIDASQDCIEHCDVAVDASARLGVAAPLAPTLTLPRKRGRGLFFFAALSPARGRGDRFGSAPSPACGGRPGWGCVDPLMSTRQIRIERPWRDVALDASSRFDAAAPSAPNLTLPRKRRRGLFFCTALPSLAEERTGLALLLPRLAARRVQAERDRISGIRTCTSSSVVVAHAACVFRDPRHAILMYASAARGTVACLRASSLWSGFLRRELG